MKELYNAQVLYNSAIHPDTDEIMHPVGRMSAQLPCGMVITGILLALYKYNTVIIILYTNSINEVLPCTVPPKGYTTEICAIGVLKALHECIGTCYGG